VHVLLLAGTDDLARALADAWRAGSPRCDVEPLSLPARPALPAGGRAPAAPSGVFVPTTALGLASVTPPPPTPAVAALHARAARADLVVVHLDVLDGDALHDGPLAEAARAAAPHAIPVVVLTGRAEATRREWSGAGVSGVHEVGDAAAVDAERVARVARTWAPSWT
jgi:hypothetical protein